MSVTEIASASAPSALTLVTPSTLVTETTPGVYNLRLDVNLLVAGDILVVRTKTKVVSGSTSRLEDEFTLAGVQANKYVITEPIPIAHEIVYEIEQLTGTGRVIPWSVLRS